MYMSGKESWGRRFADFKGQNKVEVNKYGSEPIINAFSKYRCPSVSFRCAISYSSLACSGEFRFDKTQ